MIMRGIFGAVIVGAVGILACCNADPHQEQEGALNEHNAGARFDGVGHTARNLDSMSGGKLARHIREFRQPWIPYGAARRFDYTSPYGLQREMWPVMAPIEVGGYYGEGFPKRNFDEIDRSGLDNFVKKRNFDEIDQTSMPFPYVGKRFVRFLRPSYFTQEDSSFDKKRHRADFPMDEIDLSHFPIGSKRSSEDYGLNPREMH